MRSFIQFLFITALIASASFPASSARAESLLVPLPTQEEATPWPMGMWPQGETPLALVRTLDALVEGTEPRTPTDTRAVLVIKRGELIGERYAPGFGPTSRFQSWSMAQGVIHALIGILVRDGQIDIYAPAKVPSWNRKVEDPRAAITVENLLRMESGLAFLENSTDPQNSNTLQMLFGRGHLDTAEYAASFALEADPGKRWHYASGSSNILSGIIRDAIGTESAIDYRNFIAQALFRRIGVTSAVPEFDTAHTFIGSSYVHMTARDWARLGLLYLRDGVWDRSRILPELWVDHARSPTPGSRGAYGAHFWLNAENPETREPAISPHIPGDAFMLRGFRGQVVLIIPSLDLIVVYHGRAQSDPARIMQAIADLVGAAQ